MDIIIKQRILGSLVLIAIAIVFVPALMSGNASVFHESMKSNIPEKPAFVIDLSEEQKARMARDKEQFAARAQQDHAFPLVESLADKGAAPQPAKAQQQASAVLVSKPVETGDMQLGPVAEAKKPAIHSLPAGEKANKAAPAVAKKADKPSQTLATAKPARAQRSSQPASVQVATLASTSATPPIKSPSKTAKAQSAKSSDVSKNGWVIQVASFRKSANADAMKKRLERHGMESSIVKNRSKNGMLYRVRIGPWHKKQTAAQRQAELEKIVGLNTLLVKDR